MSNGRDLKILIIDDEPDLVTRAKNDLELFNLEVVELPATRYSQQSGPCLCEWEQLVGLLQTRSAEPQNFDLLLSDTLFVSDGTAPPYPPEWVSGAHEECPNALGLLYTLAVLAYRGMNPTPYGWAVRSVNGGVAMHDPIAITCYGLLQALRGKIDVTPDLRQDVSQQLADLRGAKTIHPTWEEALRDYRRAVLEGAREHRLALHFSHALGEWARPDPGPAAAESGNLVPTLAFGARCDEVKHVTLSIGVRGRLRPSDRVRVTSLFADCLDADDPERFDPARFHRHALSWLKDCEPHLWPTAEELLEVWQAFRPGILDKNLSGHFLVAIAVMLWLKNCKIYKKFNVLTPTGVAGFVLEKWNIVSKNGGADYKLVNSKIQMAVGADLTGLAGNLINGSFPGGAFVPLREAGRRLLFEKLGWQDHEDDANFPGGFRLDPQPHEGGVSSP